ncbi:MAG: outer membrane protein assembly factor BamE [Pseudomonadales bacterium]|nr:outer membrane protein assembly factor BamE [Pseudomonadales bacterium]
MLAISLLAGCSIPGVYRIDIQQGNQITQEMVDQLKPGMTDKQVRFILGTPLIIDSFHTQRWDYVYSMDKPNEPVQSKRLSVFFEDQLLHHFDADIPAE